MIRDGVSPFFSGCYMSGVALAAPAQRSPPAIATGGETIGDDVTVDFDRKQSPCSVLPDGGGGAVLHLPAPADCSPSSSSSRPKSRCCSGGSPPMMARVRRASKERFQRASQDVMRRMGRTSKEEATPIHSPFEKRDINSSLVSMFDELIVGHTNQKLSTSKSEDLREWIPREPQQQTVRALKVNQAVAMAKAHAKEQASAEERENEEAEAADEAQHRVSIKKARHNSSPSSRFGKALRLVRVKVGGSDVLPTEAPHATSCTCTIS